MKIPLKFPIQGPASKSDLSKLPRLGGDRHRVIGGKRGPKSETRVAMIEQKAKVTYTPDVSVQDYQQQRSISWHR